MVNHILCAALSPHPPIIIPEIGKSEIAKVRSTIRSLETVAQSFHEYEVETIVIMSPHGLGFDDAVTVTVHPELEGDMAAFQAPELKLTFPSDESLLQAIHDEAKSSQLPIAFMDSDKARQYQAHIELDYASFVPLYYLHKAGFRGHIVHLACGLVSYDDMYALGKMLRKATDKVNRKIGIIASGDLSHRVTKDGPYEYHPRGEEFNQNVVAILRRGNLKDFMKLDRQLAFEVGECGLRPLFFLAGCLENMPIKTEVLSYEAPFGVGYAVAQIDLLQTPTELAWKSLIHFLTTGNHLPVPKSLVPELTLPAGAFVSLKKNQELRGCIGTMLPTEKNAAKEIIANAVKAATQDPRFLPVEPSELSEMTLSVDILGGLEAVSGEAELDQNSYGVLVRNGNRTGVLLPHLEGVDSVRQQVSIAKQKAGIQQTEPVELYRFTVTRYE